MNEFITFPRGKKQAIDSFCSVCEKAAKYKFYGVVTCDSCRTFFRRGVLRNLKAKCIRADNCCVVNPITVKKCTSCRYLKCIKVGMRPDFIANPKTHGDDPVLTMTIPLPPPLAKSGFPVDLMSGMITITRPAVPRPEAELLDLHIQNLTANEKFKLKDMMRLVQSTVMRFDENKHYVDDRRTDLNTSTCLFIYRLIRCLSTLQMSEYLCAHDVKILLKHSIGKLFHLHTIDLYDHTNKVWTIYENATTKIGRKIEFGLDGDEQISPIMASTFHNLVLNMDPAVRTDFIYATIIAAICFYDPRHEGLSNVKVIENEQNVFLSILKKLVISQLNYFSKTVEKSSTIKEMTINIFERLQIIHDAFETTVLYVDPGKQFDLISNKLLNLRK